MQSSHPRHRLRSTALVGATLVVTLSACSSGGASTKASGDPGSTVHLKLLQFTPRTLTVKPGTSVEFVNDEVITHTVTTGTYTVGANSFRSAETADGKLNKTLGGKGDRVSYTFTSPGTYTYFCSIHKAMQGEIVVR